MSAFFRAPTTISRSAIAAPRLARSIGVQPQQPKVDPHPLPEGTPKNGPGGAERILGSLAGVALLVGGWTWFRSSQIQREKTGVQVTGQDPTKGPKENQPSSTVG